MTRKRVAILISGRGSNMAALMAAAGAPDYPATIALVASKRTEAPGLETAARDGIPTAHDRPFVPPGVMRHGATMQSIIDAASVIEDAGFTIQDDLVHGFGGGYFPPVLGSRSRPAGPLPHLTLQSGMTCVVQPNVVTPDQKAGVQVGELVLVTGRGIERMHGAGRGFFRIRGGG